MNVNTLNVIDAAIQLYAKHIATEGFRPVVEIGCEKVEAHLSGRLERTSPNQVVPNSSDVAHLGRLLGVRLDLESLSRHILLKLWTELLPAEDAVTGLDGVHEEVCSSRARRLGR